MKTDESLTRSEPVKGQEPNYLFDNFDLYLADAKDCFTRLTLIITLIHSLWCHSSANHFNYFVRLVIDSQVIYCKLQIILCFIDYRMLKERKEELIRTEAQFLFICKIIGPFLSKIHMENTALFVEVNCTFLRVKIKYQF